MRTHSAELRNHIARKNGIYDIIGIQETFLKPDVKFNIAGYVTLRRDRLDASKGGLVTLIKHSIKYISSYNIKDVEELYVEITTSTGYVTISYVYMSPSLAVDKDKLKPLFISSKNIIVGDFNASSTLWGSPVTNH